MPDNSLITLALGVLPPTPCSIAALGDDKARVEMRITGTSNDRIEARLSVGDCNKNDRLVIAVDQGRGGFDVECTVSEMYFMGGTEALIELEVTAVRRRKPHRGYERMPVDVTSEVRVIVAERLAPGKPFAARLLDISSHGAAFVTDQDLVVGDLVGFAIPAAGTSITTRARIMNVSWHAFGRQRVGCRFSEPIAAVRHLLVSQGPGRPLTVSSEPLAHRKAA